jgi:predicted Zn-ribbon and HTH transcriptional regulator
VAAVNSHGPHCYLAKLDIESAFKHIIVKYEQCDLLGFTLKDKHTDQLLYYISTCLPFGLRSSPKLFDQYAEGMEYIMYKNGVSQVFHYLDDYLTLSSDIETCQSNLSIMLNTCAELGFRIQPKKLVTPSKCVEMLGIVIYTLN